MKMVLEFTDLVLFDIKHLDPLKHSEATGVGNQLILENLLSVGKETGSGFACPLSPGYNDTEENILAVAALGKSLGRREALASGLPRRR